MLEGQGEPSRNVLRSQVSRVEVPVTFKNRSGRRVRVIWRNFEGEDVPFAILDKFAAADSGTASHWTSDVYTFVTHPWIAVDESSNERMLLNFQEVYMPIPSPVLRVVDYHEMTYRKKIADVLITAPGRKRWMWPYAKVLTNNPKLGPLPFI